MHKIMFVCTGNICRSPTAEAVLSHMGVASGVEASSSGIEGFHVGQGADPRAIEVASDRGYTMDDIRAQRFTKADFETQDLIVAMDEGHYKTLQSVAEHNSHSDKIVLFGDFCTSCQLKNVPDPYYGAKGGFLRVLDIIEDGCRGIVAHLGHKDRANQSS